MSEQEKKSEEPMSDAHARKKAEKEAKKLAKQQEKEAKKNMTEDEKKAAGDAKKSEASERDAKKAARLAERQAKTTEGQSSTQADENDFAKDKYGDRELNRSQGNPEARFGKIFTRIESVDHFMDGEKITVRCRLHNTRAKGKMCFVVLRQSFATIQGALFVDDARSKGMITFASKVPKESIVEVVATVKKVQQIVDTCSQKTVELDIHEFHVIDRSAPILPFQIDDASRVVLNQASEDGAAEGKVDTEEQKEESKEESKEENKFVVVKQDIRLNNRIIDLRVTTNQAIMRLQSAVCQLFREYLYQNQFVEIHSPKLIGGASEGGSNVFTLKYFNEDACLAQSPQLYKQMALCGDLERVFEIGPVFRAENSNTNRHLCEFTGLDMEMEIKEHYFEVLDMLGDMFIYIFNGLEKRFKKELQIVKQQYPFEDFKCRSPVLKINFKEGVKMLQEAGIEQGALEDLSTETEKALGRLVKEKYDTDYYMLYGYPAAARPFYTMLDPEDPLYTNSYDFFMRGEEITSGAQRVHNVELLKERCGQMGIPHETLTDYIEAFKYGAPAHGGAGIGLERVVKFYCGLHNIRKASLFPRDPKRLRP